MKFKYYLRKDRKELFEKVKAMILLLAFQKRINREMMSICGLITKFIRFWSSAYIMFKKL